MIENLFGGGGGGGGGLESVVAGTGISVDNTNPDNPIVTNTSLNTDEVAKVSSNDTTAGYLNGKLVAGTNITLTENNNGGNETLTIAAAGGVTGYTGSQNTAAPNNTVNASRLLVDAASTNADAVVQPKGTGALLAQLPDGAATGGNKRGAYAVDLQTARGAAAQVASGAASVIIGGSTNTASGSASVVIGGDTNTASGVVSTVVGGANNTASGNYCAAFGLQSTSDRYGMIAHGSGRFSSNGDAQREEYVLRRITNDATPTELTCDSAPGGASNRMTIAADSTYVFSALVVGRTTASTDESGGYKVEGCIERQGATVQFVGTPVVTVFGENVAGWDCTATADNTNKALVITVTGAIGTIRWVASVRLVKVQG